MSDEFDLPPAVAAKRTIRYADDEIEAAPERANSSIPWPNLPSGRLKRHDSTNSLRSERSMSRSVDPALALPAVYRTVSFNISTSQEKKPEHTKEAIKAKAKAGVGTSTTTHVFVRVDEMLTWYRFRRCRVAYA